MDEFFQLIPKKYTTKLVLSKSHSKELVFRHGHIAITDYRMGDNPEFEKALSVFDELTWKYHLKGGYYVPELREFRINRGYSPGMLSKFFHGYGIRVDNDAYPADTVDIHLMTAPRDDMQKVALSFMCCQGKYQSNAKFTQQIIDATVGAGKTFCGVATACFMRSRVVIIVPFGKLLGQWKKSFTTFTDIQDDEILIVKGSGACKKIIDGEYEDIKVFIFSVDTLVSFRDRYGNLEVIELLRKTRAYIKIVDEVHRDMNALSMIEALSNFRLNYYMSASPGRTAKKENWIFNTCFRNVPRLGESFDMKNDKHISIMVKRYRFCPTPEQQKRMTQPRTKWLNSKSYERELISAPDEQNEDFQNSIIAMLNWSKRMLKPGNKILILSETINGTAFTQNLAEQVFPNRTSRYYGSMKDKEKEEALKADIICATVSSLGTGADIPGIQHVYNVATYSNWISVIQTAGRARKLNDGTDVFYIEFVNMSYIKTLRQFEKRKSELAKNSKTGKIIMVD